MAGMYIETRDASPQQEGLCWICDDSVTGVLVSKTNKYCRNTWDLMHTEKYKSGLNYKFDVLYSFASRPKYSGNLSGKDFFHSGMYCVFTYSLVTTERSCSGLHLPCVMCMKGCWACFWVCLTVKVLLDA